MELEASYKQTEVGIIPEEWDCQPLRSILIQGQLGGNYPNHESEAGNPLIKMGNIGRGQIDLSKVQYIPPSVVPNEMDRLHCDDVLFNTRNTLDLVGKVAIWRNELPVAYFNSNLMRLEFKPEKISSNAFVNYVFNTDSYISLLRTIATGTTSVAAIYTRDLLSLPFPLPSLSEQRAIAAALSDTDSLLSSLDRLLAKKRDIRQAVMQQLLTGKQRLPGFSGEWERKEFGNLSSPRRERIDPKRSGVLDFCVEMEHIEPETGYLLGHTSTGEQSSLKTIFRPGDVLFGKLRAYLKKYWLADRQGVCSTEIWSLVPYLDFVTSAFLFQIVKTEPFMDAASTAYGTHMPRSDWNTVKKLEVNLPPIPEQTAIAAVLSDMDEEIDVLTHRRDKTRALKQGMMQELLTGRTRFV